MKTWLIPTVLTFFAGIASGAGEPVRPASRPFDLTPEFAAVRERIRPRPEEELWKTIPWKTSLLEARQVAAKAGRPLFVWSMDGHPLCLG